MVKARQIVGILYNDRDTDCDLDPDSPVPDTTLPSPDVVAYRVQTRQPPYMDVFHGHRVVRVIIDSGATGNAIRHSTSKHLGCPLISSAQSVQQADGSSQLQVVRELLTYGSKSPPSPLQTVRRAFVLRATAPSNTVWPGEFL